MTLLSGSCSCAPRDLCATPASKLLKPFAICTVFSIDCINMFAAPATVFQVYQPLQPRSHSPAMACKTTPHHSTAQHSTAQPTQTQTQTQTQ
eukprot:CAMPEP_0174324956 /NCGR_PEP_ID=MMETSP0810-20121108/12880_1 /TAXON_ID=73025 ORGANISM="Eutreptiella gymnastica-like, Strain CCMP1594" /NCGR_SAMPLE_ID=MMETSP0810 /ASSEMBLY_ACC=CAM_ASM_000659 /LENGTH=91 /DNA_ID=CAMNT_0015438011 /DNA_START=325 /DNA_END=597 /DNA_ORIENTATION=+